MTGKGVVARLLSDWTLSPIFIAGSGRPFNVVLGIDANGDGVSTRDRPCVREGAGQPCIPNSNVGRNVGHGAPFYNVDMRLARRFSFTENKYVEVTFEAFNLFNHTNFTGINNVIGTTPLTTGRPLGIEGLAPTMPFAWGCFVGGLKSVRLMVKRGLLLQTFRTSVKAASSLF